MLEMIGWTKADFEDEKVLSSDTAPDFYYV